MRCCSETVNFLINIYKGHSIARPLGRGMGCHWWIQHLFDTLPHFLQLFMQYPTIWTTLLRHMTVFWFKKCHYAGGPRRLPPPQLHLRRSRDLAHASIPLAQTPWGLTGRAWLQAGAQQAVTAVDPSFKSLGIDSRNAFQNVICKCRPSCIAFDESIVITAA